VVFKDFFWLWGSSDRQGASSAVHPSSSSLGRMWLSGPFGDFPSAINNVRMAMGGAAATARHQHGLKVEDEGHHKDFDVIFVFVEVFCTIQVFF
jgi:hypothetical protein